MCHQLSVTDQALFIFDHFEWEVGEEVRFHSCKEHTCCICQSVSLVAVQLRTAHKEVAVNKINTAILASRPNEIATIDFTQNGLENVSVVIDVFSKFAVTVSTQDQYASNGGPDFGC